MKQGSKEDVSPAQVAAWRSLWDRLLTRRPSEGKTLPVRSAPHGYAREQKEKERGGEAQTSSPR